MGEQGDLFEGRMPPPPEPEEPSLAQRFRAFHLRNPEVYAELKGLCLDAVRRGKRRIGVGALFEVLRWNRWLQTTDDEPAFKLNNNYRSRYARLLMLNEPALVGIFEVRELKTAADDEGTDA